MEFLNIRQTTGFKHPVFGEGTLMEGGTYYTFGQFAREAEAAGMGSIVRGEMIHPTRFQPAHLREKDRFRKVLLMFSGGFGDAITVGIVIRKVIEKYGIGLDLCCDTRKWESIFEPMGIPCLHVPYPPESKILSRYDAVLLEVVSFFSSGDGLRSSPVINLARGFGVDPGDLKAGYFIPPAIRERCLLPDTGNVRIGVNFDSNGLVKSYPDGLQVPLLRTLLDSGLELYVLGTRKGSEGYPNVKGLKDLRGKTRIAESAALLQQMDAVVGVDSFVVHLAHLLGRPSIVLLSTTLPAYFEWHKRMVCITSGLECSPCLAVFDRCPLGHSGCRAFLHESIAPLVILGHLMRMVSDCCQTCLHGYPEKHPAPLP